MSLWPVCRLPVIRPVRSGRRVTVGRPSQNEPRGSVPRRPLCYGPVLWPMLLALGLGLTLQACAGGTADFYNGHAARPDNRFPIQTMQGQESTWPAKDLSLHYKVATGEELFDISGFVEFSSNLAKYPTITSFRIYLHFLDTEGIILDTRLLWVVGVNSDASLVRWTFQRQWPQPPGAVAVAFSYKGGVMEAGGDNSFGKTHTGWPARQMP